MKKVKMIEELRAALRYLPDGKAIDLEGDTFLVEGGLDGSDKCYGFVNRGGELLVITRECSDGYRIEEMNKSDLDYMFNLSQIMSNIKQGTYEIVDEDFL